MTEVIQSVENQIHEIPETIFRVYDGQNETVLKTYKDINSKQCLEYVLSMKKKYQSFPNLKLSLWEAFYIYDQVIDESDPDTDLPQYVHAFQTALSLETRYYEKGSQNLFRKDIEIKSLFHKEWDSLPEVAKKIYEEAKFLHNLYPDIEDFDWFILVGFIHDLGKVLLAPEFGNLPQWSVVGDIFPVGCRMHEACVYSERGFQKENPDFNDPIMSTELGIYSKNCGFDNLQMCFSHDDYLASILENNQTNFPKEAFYVIRYHSFYPFHTPKNGVRGYEYFATDYDWKMLPLVKALQKADLYSKSRDIPTIEQAKERYGKLIDKYIVNEKMQW